MDRENENNDKRLQSDVLQGGIRSFSNSLFFCHYSNGLHNEMLKKKNIGKQSMSAIPAFDNVDNLNY